MKLAVSPDGSFHICEKMNTNYPIGNCYKGIDSKNVYSIMKNYYDNIIKKNECHLCIAREFCGICFATVDTNKLFESEQKCKIQKMNMTSV